MTSSDPQPTDPSELAPRDNRLHGITGQTAADVHLSNEPADELLRARLRDSSIEVHEAEFQQLLAEVNDIATSEESQGRARERGVADRASDPS